MKYAAEQVVAETAAPAAGPAAELLPELASVPPVESSAGLMSELAAARAAGQFAALAVGLPRGLVLGTTAERDAVVSIEPVVGPAAVEALLAEEAEQHVDEPDEPEGPVEGWPSVPVTV